MPNPYVEIISEFYPDVGCHACGDTYSDVVYDSGEAIPPQETLEALFLSLSQKAIWTNIKAYRDTRLNSGFKVGTYWFHSDDPSRIKYLGLMLMGAGIPAGLQWKTMSGAFVTMTQTLAYQIFTGVAGWDSATFIKAEQHKAAMQASADPLNYDYTTGWPAIFGE